MALSDDVAGVEKRVSALGLTIKFVCDRAGVPASTWSHWKIGTRRPLKEKWDAIIAAVDDLERRFSS